MNTGTREKKLRDFKDSRSVGILFDASEEKDYNEVHRYVNKLQRQNKEVKALGLILDPVLANHLMPMLTFDYIYAKDLNWYEKPKTVKYREFCMNAFDILIDLSRKDHAALLFAAGETPAAFKVGKYSEAGRNIFDMMIEIGEEEPVDKVIEHFDHYINLLKPAKK